MPNDEGENSKRLVAEVGDGCDLSHAIDQLVEAPLIPIEKCGFKFLSISSLVKRLRIERFSWSKRSGYVVLVDPALSFTVIRHNGIAPTLFIVLTKACVTLAGKSSEWVGARRS